MTKTLKNPHFIYHNCEKCGCEYNIQHKSKPDFTRWPFKICMKCYEKTYKPLNNRDYYLGSQNSGDDIAGMTFTALKLYYFRRRDIVHQLIRAFDEDPPVMKFGHVTDYVGGITVNEYFQLEQEVVWDAIERSVDEFLDALIMQMKAHVLEDENEIAIENELEMPPIFPKSLKIKPRIGHLELPDLYQNAFYELKRND